MHTRALSAFLPVRTRSKASASTCACLGRNPKHTVHLNLQCTLGARHPLLHALVKAFWMEKRRRKNTVPLNLECTLGARHVPLDAAHRRRRQAASHGIAWHGMGRRLQAACAHKGGDVYRNERDVNRDA